MLLSRFGSGPFKEDIQPFTSMGKLTLAAATKLDLEKKLTYHATMRCTNAAGLRSEVVTSDGISIQPETELKDDEESSLMFNTVAVGEDEAPPAQTFGAVDVPAGAAEGGKKLQAGVYGQETKMDDGMADPDSTVRSGVGGVELLVRSLTDYIRVAGSPRKQLQVWGLLVCNGGFGREWQRGGRLRFRGARCH